MRKHALEIPAGGVRGCGLFIAGCALLLSCTHQELPKGQAVIPATSQNDLPRQAKPPELLVERIEEAPREPGKRFNLRLKEANVREILASFSKSTPFNFVYGPEVQGKVTVDLKEVTLEEALESILAPLHFTFRQDRNFIRVIPQTVETKIFTLDYVNTMRTGSTSTFAGGVGGAGGAGAGGVGGAGAGGVGGAGAGGAGGAGAGGVGGAGASGGGSSSTVTSIDRADVFGELENAIKSLLSKDGKANVNKTASTIVVTDYSTNLEQVERYLEMAETSLHRQVSIQATIAEVSLTEGFQYGIDWGALAKLAGGRGVLPFGGLQSGRVMTQSLAPATGVFRVGILGADFSAILNLLAQDTKVTLLSRPRISALNNQRALIQLGTQQVFFQVSRLPATFPGQLEQITTVPQTVFVGLSLSVTAQIGKGRIITLTILPTESSIDGFVDSPIAASGGGATRVPNLSVREVQTIVRVRDGETLILGGLVREQNTTNIQKVPGLGDIPWLGKLFTQSVETKEKKELVIFMTPTIVEDEVIETMTKDAERGVRRTLK